MDEELGSHFVLAVEELGLAGIWTTVREVRESLCAPEERWLCWQC